MHGVTTRKVTDVTLGEESGDELDVALAPNVREHSGDQLMGLSFDRTTARCAASYDQANKEKENYSLHHRLCSSNV